MTIAGDLDRARHLTLSAEEVAARDLLVSQLPLIEQADRDDYALEVFAQLGEIYLVRTAYEGVVESISRIRDCLAIYVAIRSGQRPDLVAEVTMSDHDIDHMICRYTRRVEFLEAGLAAARGDHDGAAAHLETLIETGGDFDDLRPEHRNLICRTRILIASSLCDDDLYAASVPVWAEVLDVLQNAGPDTEDAETDHLFVTGALGYGRFCIESGRLDEAEPWLRRAGARAQARDWKLATARAQLERGAAAWSAGQHSETQDLVTEAYPVIAEHARAHDVSRSWLYFGLIRVGLGRLREANECWEHAERHWREIERPLHIHRILLQRSWIALFRGAFDDAIAMVNEARRLLDASPRHSWLQYARLDAHLGNIWRADALAEMGFDGLGKPGQSWEQVEARHAAGTGTFNCRPGSRKYRRGMVKLDRATDLKVPAALAVDSVRYTITDAGARARWAKSVAAPLMAGAFAVAWESDNTELTCELIEYHSARGTFSTDRADEPGPAAEWTETATAVVPVEAELAPQLAVAAAAAPVGGEGALTRLGPLPPLRIDPSSGPILSHYRELALQRYGRDVTASGAEWTTWP
ncbi:tetratricopeptide repeat protein [Mycolicibacterium lutetiense]